MLEELPSVFLVGPMGSGKTTIGRLLAKQLGREFVDSDWYVESQTGADIAWIFAKEGEAGFRVRETRAIDELTQQSQIVLATGGGAVISAENRKFLHERGVVVYLNASVDVQMIRTAKDKSRPLLQQPNPRQILQDLYQIRDPLYRQVAHIIMPTGHTYPRHMVHQLLRQLEIFFSDSDSDSDSDSNSDHATEFLAAVADTAANVKADIDNNTDTKVNTDTDFTAKND